MDEKQLVATIEQLAATWHNQKLDEQGGEVAVRNASGQAFLLDGELIQPCSTNGQMPGTIFTMPAARLYRAYMLDEVPTNGLSLWSAHTWRDPLCRLGDPCAPERTVRIRAHKVPTTRGGTTWRSDGTPSLRPHMRLVPVEKEVTDRPSVRWAIDRGQVSDDSFFASLPPWWYIADSDEPVVWANLQRPFTDFFSRREYPAGQCAMWPEEFARAKAEGAVAPDGEELRDVIATREFRREIPFEVGPRVWFEQVAYGQALVVAEGEAESLAREGRAVSRKAKEAAREFGVRYA